MNRWTNHIALIASGSILCLSGCDTRSKAPDERSTQPTSDRSTTATPADSTARKREDQRRDARTPMDQSESSEHIKVTADIRRALMDDDSLSSAAKNSKIITDKYGDVWLRGVVDYLAEKQRIEDIARQYAGAGTVTNELEVKAGG